MSVAFRNEYNACGNPVYAVLLHDEQIAKIGKWNGKWEVYPKITAADLNEIEKFVERLNAEKESP